MKKSIVIVVEDTLLFEKMKRIDANAHFNRYPISSAHHVAMTKAIDRSYAERNEQTENEAKGLLRVDDEGVLYVVQASMQINLTVNGMNFYKRFLEGKPAVFIAETEGEYNVVLAYCESNPLCSVIRSGATFMPKIKEAIEQFVNTEQYA